MDVPTLCLAVLAHGPASGYEIKKELEEGAYAHFFRASFGSIYPALARLAAEGLIDGREQEQAKRPDKKVYSLTPSGRHALGERLQAPIHPDYIRSEFCLVLFHADLLPPRHRRALIEERIQWLRERIDGMARTPSEGDGGCARYQGAGPDFVCGFGRAIYEAELAYLEANRAWFDLPEANAAE